MIIRSYLSSLPRHVNGDEKINALTYFAEGAAKCGDSASCTQSQAYEDCDVAAIIGNAFGANPKKTQLPHYAVRKMVIDTQTRLRRYWLSIDSNVFIYLNPSNPHKYLRYSFNGVFPATGIYCNDRPGEENWANIRRDYNIDLKPWRNTGNHLLITLQRPMGWSMRGVDLMSWLEQTLCNIRTHTDRPVIIRWHPGDWKNYVKYEKIMAKYKAMLSPQHRHITADLVNCWALVCHNSTPAAVAAIEGIPVFVTDDPSYCQAGDVANTDFARLENPHMPDRDHWIRKLAQCHWSFNDVRTGRCWSHMREWITPVVPGSK